jgi:uncharacterized protein with NRDE domain
MCLIFISVNDHPKYKLIVAANRDEFYQRKTAAVSEWHDHPGVIGGRDMEAQGTWMAMTKGGKIGMVTNYRDLKNINPSAPTRGQLVTDFLFNDYDTESYLKEIHLKASQYNGFNLVIGSLDELYYYSNYQSKIVKLNKGFYGLSNHLLDTPWPKVKRGKEKMKSVLSQSDPRPSALFEVLTDEKIAPDDQLPSTGLDIERERALSAMFIKSPNYGSRCSTVVLVDNDNNVSYIERVYDLETFDHTEKEFDWKI